MYTKLDNKSYEVIKKQVGKSYKPEKKKKPKLTLKQLFFLKKNLK